MKKFILIVLVLLLTGCYDYHELNDLEIVSSLIIDYKDDQYVVNVEILDTSSSAKTGSFFLSGEGKSLEAAINNVYFDSALTPFYSHMKSLILTEEVAERGIEPFLDFLLRDTQFRKDFFIFVTPDVDAILEFETEPKESVGEMARMSAIRNHESNGRYKTCTFRDIAFAHLRDNYYMVGSLEIKDEKISLEDTYLFIDNKLGFKLDPEACLLANILTDQNKKFQIYGDYTYEMHGFSIKQEIKKDKIVLSLKGHARILDAQGSNSLDGVEIEKLERELNDKISKDGMKIIEYAKRMGHDMFNFNYYYYLHYPKLVEDDTWKTIDYEVKSELKISEKGLLLNSLGGSIDGK